MHFHFRLVPKAVFFVDSSNLIICLILGKHGGLCTSYPQYAINPSTEKRTPGKKIPARAQSIFCAFTSPRNFLVVWCFDNVVRQNHLQLLIYDLQLIARTSYICFPLHLKQAGTCHVLVKTYAKTLK